MEWTIRQQMQCLLLSVVLGVMQGLVLDVITGCVHITPRKRWLWTDILFGPIAAIITFCGSLVIMDGQLHPLLYLGVFFGLIGEHVTVGVWVCGFVRYVRKKLRLWRGVAVFAIGSCWRRICALFVFKKKSAENGEKS